MAYTRVWAKTNPPGSQAANTADDELRNLREDVEERMAALVTGWSTAAPTDPVVPIASIKGNVTTKTYNLHHCAFKANNAAGTITADKVLSLTGGTTFWAPLILPQTIGLEVTIKTLDVIVDRAGVSSIVIKLRRRTVGVLTDVGSVAVSAGTGEASANAFTGTEPAGSFSYYFIEVATTNALHALFGAVVGYSCADCRSTL